MRRKNGIEEKDSSNQLPVEKEDQHNLKHHAIDPELIFPSGSDSALAYQSPAYESYVSSASSGNINSDQLTTIVENSKALSEKMQQSRLTSFYDSEESDGRCVMQPLIVV